jgi:hypothetical protein
VATVTMRVYVVFSALVQSVATAAAALYAADPDGARVAAVAEASNGTAVMDAAAGVALAAKRAAATANAFADGTLLTGSPPASLASRLAAAASTALVAAGKSRFAALANASSMAPTVTADVGSATIVISTQTVSGSALAYGKGASDSGPIAFREILIDGLSSGVAFALASVLAVSFYYRRWHQLQAPKRAAYRLNPLHASARPIPPRGKPPAHAFKGYSRG